DGGIPGDRLNSLLHLFDGTVTRLPGYYGGGVTADSIIDVLADILTATSPAAVQTLELAATHGRDHSSHMFVASAGLWAAARIGYAGAVTWNRGYNVEFELPTLDGDDLAAARTMLGYYEACAYHCGPCGESCASLSESHEVWIARQYQQQRVPSIAGKLALGDMCLDGALALGDCTAAPTVELMPAGALRIGDRCVTSGAADELSLEPCNAAPEQYWMLDSEGVLFNGRRPALAADMTYDHVRCLVDQRAPTCGATLHAQWQFVP
ncbi:MAG TPA: hypothetical protein VL326_38185, partial [Kofleriaceae bacterium]|nr:hypothetical protein [Kofleriaceae bacterium]